MIPTGSAAVLVRAGHKRQRKRSSPPTSKHGQEKGGIREAEHTAPDMPGHWFQDHVYYIDFIEVV